MGFNHKMTSNNDSNDITVGIIGCGFVGGALKVWLEEHNPNVKIVVSDPPRPNRGRRVARSNSNETTYIKSSR